MDSGIFPRWTSFIVRIFYYACRLLFNCILVYFGHNRHQAYLFKNNLSSVLLSTLVLFSFVCTFDSKDLHFFTFPGHWLLLSLDIVCVLFFLQASDWWMDYTKKQLITPGCRYPVESGKQCGECKGCYYDVCTNQTPVTLKWFSKNNCVSLRQCCCSDSNSFLTEAIVMVSAVKENISKRNWDLSNGILSTDSRRKTQSPLTHIGQRRKDGL